MAIKQLRLYSKKNFEQLKSVTCEMLLRQIHIKSSNGDLALCCTTWMPWVVGNINEQSLLSYIESDDYLKIMKTVSDGTYSYCDKQICPEIQYFLKNNEGRGLIPVERYQKLLDDKQLMIMMNYDRSCNLQCPSCRNELIFYKNYSDEIMKTHENVVKSINELLDNGYKLTLCITGSGDAFASKLFSNFIKTFSHPSNNYRFSLNTNGNMMTPSVLKWENVKTRTRCFDVSIDAATAETYSIVRKGGNFDRLKKNLDHVNKKVKEGYFDQKFFFQTNFILSAMNFREVADFAKWMINDYDTLNRVWFNCIANWGHIKDEDFKKLAIWDVNHPDHQEFLEIMKDPIFKHPLLHLGNLSKFVP